MCGVVEGGIIPGLWGYEAGQSGVGDIFDWFVDAQRPAAVRASGGRPRARPARAAHRAAATQAVGEHGLVALDWHSGNRSVLVDHDLSGLVVGLTLATRPEDVYRALLEATAFGTRMIVEAFQGAGVPVEEFVVAGGLLKNPLLMQIYADVTATCRSRRSAPTRARRSAPRSTPRSPRGRTRTCTRPPRRWAGSTAARYVPIPANVAAYDELYAEYRALHDHFGRGGNDVMHRLKARRRHGKEVPTR